MHIYKDKVIYKYMNTYCTELLESLLNILCMGVLCNFYTVGTGSLHLHTSHQPYTQISNSTTQNFEKINSSKGEVRGLGARES